MVIHFPQPAQKIHPKECAVIMRDGNQFVVIVGMDLVEGVAGFGDTIPDALRDLATNMEREGWHSNSVV